MNIRKKWILRIVLGAAAALLCVTPWKRIPKRTAYRTADEYPYQIAGDRAGFNPARIDITVGDHLYMTQINDWYLNFQEYAGKTVEIEGYYIDTGSGYTFVGRNGPSCPYCTGGYVDFEFQTDQDCSGFISGETWISVAGILREGNTRLSSGERKPFYYIEAIRVKALNRPGINPVVD